MVMKKRYKLLSILLIGTGLFNIADYFLTLYVISQGHEEANPIIDLILGTKYFPIVKLLVVPLLLLTIWKLRDQMNLKELMTGVWVMFISYYSLMVYFRVVFL